MPAWRQRCPKAMLVYWAESTDRRNTSRWRCVHDGSARATTGDPGDAWPDLVARSAVDSAARGSGPVLAGDRSWPVERGRGWRGRAVTSGGSALVPPGWRDAAHRPGSGVGALPVVHRAGGVGDPARTAMRRARDRSPPRPLTLDDLPGAASQRVDPQPHGDVSSVDRAVARRTSRLPPQGLEARRERPAASVCAGPPRGRDRQARRGSRAGPAGAVGRSPPRAPSRSTVGHFVEPRTDLQPAPARLPR